MKKYTRAAAVLLCSMLFSSCAELAESPFASPTFTEFLGHAASGNHTGMQDANLRLQNENMQYLLSQ